MGSAYYQKKFKKIAVTYVYKVREKLYNEYVSKGKQEKTQKKLYNLI